MEPFDNDESTLAFLWFLLVFHILKCINLLYEIVNKKLRFFFLSNDGASLVGSQCAYTAHAQFVWTSRNI